MRFALASAAIAAALFLGMVVLIEVGRRLGLRETARHGTNARAGVGVVDGAVYSLLGLLIGFTFSGAANRFDQRRQLIGDQVTSIRIAWQRIELLPIERQEPIRAGVRRYVDALLDTRRNPDKLTDLVSEPEVEATARNDLWTQSVAACVDPSGEKARMLLLPSLSETFGVVEKERLARRIHPPAAVFGMLALTALTAALFAGYGMATGPTRNWVYVAGVAAAIAVTTFVIIDLEYPRLGLVRVDGFDDALAELRATMNGS